MHCLKDIIKDSLLKLNKIDSKKSYVYLIHCNILFSAIREHTDQYLNLIYEIKTLASFEWHWHLNIHNMLGWGKK